MYSDVIRGAKSTHKMMIANCADTGVAPYFLTSLSEESKKAWMVTFTDYYNGKHYRRNNKALLEGYLVKSKDLTKTFHKRYKILSF